MLTFVGCDKNTEQQNIATEDQGAMELAIHHDTTAMNLMDSSKYNLAIEHYVDALKYYDQTDEIRGKRGPTKDI